MYTPVIAFVNAVRNRWRRRSSPPLASTIHPYAVETVAGSGAVTLGALSLLDLLSGTSILAWAGVGVRAVPVGCAAALIAAGVALRHAAFGRKHRAILSAGLLVAVASLAAVFEVLGVPYAALGTAASSRGVPWISLATVFCSIVVALVVACRVANDRASIDDLREATLVPALAVCSLCAVAAAIGISVTSRAEQRVFMNPVVAAGFVLLLVPAAFAMSRARRLDACEATRTSEWYSISVAVLGMVLTTAIWGAAVRVDASAGRRRSARVGTAVAAALTRELAHAEAVLRALWMQRAGLDAENWRAAVDASVSALSAIHGVEERGPDGRPTWRWLRIEDVDAPADPPSRAAVAVVWPTTLAREWSSAASAVDGTTLHAVLAPRLVLAAMDGATGTSGDDEAWLCTVVLANGERRTDGLEAVAVPLGTEGRLSLVVRRRDGRLLESTAPHWLLLIGIVATSSLSFSVRQTSRIRSSLDAARSSGMAALAASRRFHALFQSLPDATLVVDERGRIVEVNDMASVLFGVKSSDLVGTEIETLMPERFRAALRSHR